MLKVIQINVIIKNGTGTPSELYETEQNRRKIICFILILKRGNTHANHFQCASCYRYQISDVTPFAVCSKDHQNKQQILVKGETLILSLSTRLREHKKKPNPLFYKMKKILKLTNQANI